STASRCWRRPRSSSSAGRPTTTASPRPGPSCARRPTSRPSGPWPPPPPSRGLLREHPARFPEARTTLDRSIDACRAAGLFRPMLTSCFAATLACANLGDLRGALGRLALRERMVAEVEDRFYHARAATAGSWLWRELGDLGRARALA